MHNLFKVAFVLSLIAASVISYYEGKKSTTPNSPIDVDLIIDVQSDSSWVVYDVANDTLLHFD